jgi:hypothetical protein
VPKRRPPKRKTNKTNGEPDDRAYDHWSSAVVVDESAGRRSGERAHDVQERYGPGDAGTIAFEFDYQ